jgi:transcriptional regulator with PAS, ATPase and Fis domain
MGSPSALQTIQKLQQEFDGSLEFLNRELPFARFAIARFDAKGGLPQQLFTSATTFPAFDPRTLDQAVRLRQSIVEPLHQVFLVPCLYQQQMNAVLFAVHEQGKWSTGEQILVELAASELGRMLAPVRPGLTLGAPVRNLAKNRSASNLIGSGKKLKDVLHLVDRVAPTAASVLVLGESGTGKELLARRIHDLSPRKDQPFVAINCGAITESLLESELFGHEKGSFTGAVNTKKGLAEVAHGGTLFLDEIGELPLALQSKLLRFLQEGEIFRVGGKEAIRVDVRIVSATNRNLEAEIVAGRFREDLFYRLNTITLQSPALRERMEDLKELMEHFASGLYARMSPEALDLLRAYRWPGNIRELQNLTERLQILSGGSAIEAKDLPASIREQAITGGTLTLSGPPPVEMALEELERIHILRCLQHHEGNKTRAAQSLGITIKTLYNKLHRYGILDKSESKL